MSEHESIIRDAIADIDPPDAFRDLLERHSVARNVIVRDGKVMFEIHASDTESKEASLEAVIPEDFEAFEVSVIDAVSRSTPKEDILSVTTEVDLKHPGREAAEWMETRNAQPADLIEDVPDDAHVWAVWTTAHWADEGEAKDLAIYKYGADAYVTMAKDAEVELIAGPVTEKEAKNIAEVAKGMWRPYH